MDSLLAKLNYLKSGGLMNGYSLAKVQQAMKRPYKKHFVVESQEEDRKVLMLPYCGTVSSYIWQMVGKFGFTQFIDPWQN